MSRQRAAGVEHGDGVVRQHERGERAHNTDFHHLSCALHKRRRRFTLNRKFSASSFALVTIQSFDASNECVLFISHKNIADDKNVIPYAEFDES